MSKRIKRFLWVGLVSTREACELTINNILQGCNPEMKDAPVGTHDFTRAGMWR